MNSIIYGELQRVVFRAVVVENNHLQVKSKETRGVFLGLRKQNEKGWGEGGQGFTVVGIWINRSSFSVETLLCFILMLNYAGLSFNQSYRKLRVYARFRCSTEMAWGIGCA